MHRKCLIIFMIALISSMTSLAQSYTLKGVLKDTNVNIALYNGSVVLLHARDSFIVADTRADKEGRFTLSNLSDTTAYVLFFSYPGYVAYTHRIAVKASNNGLLDMGNVSLLLKEKLLKEVIVKSQTASIKIKGDTTEYTADSFKVQPNASVEELLRQLPGLQVDQAGNITAQGQKVKKVLVDGEEFFSDDPTLVTRNLRADMIDKVQVFDKKSDAATFSGIDDGIKDKTINLKIKEDKNNGIFGKIDAGIGTNDHYSAQGMLNAFKGRRKLAVFGTTGNIGRTGLGSADRQRIGDDSEASDTYNGKGLPEQTNAGVHYDNKWNGDKQSLNGNYKFNNNVITGDDNTISQNNLPSGLILSNARSHFDNHSTSQSANGKYIFKLDSSAVLTAYADGNLSDNENGNYGYTQNRRGDSSMIFDNQSQENNDHHRGNYNMNLSWEKRLKKPGRTISLYFNNNFADDHATGESVSQSTFYDEAGQTDSTGYLNLRRQTESNWRTNIGKALYTEAITKKLSLILNYEVRNNYTSDDKRSFNQEDPKNIDAAFSTKMNTYAWSNQGGAAISYVSSKLVFKAGNNIRSINMKIDDLLEDYTLKKHFLNWSPNVNLRYTPQQYSSFNLSYNGNTVNPERTQLRPFRYNNSQLVTYIGNPNLENGFTHRLSTNYNSSKTFSNVYMGINADITFNTNPIVQASNVTPAGKYIYQYVNMRGYTNNNYSANAYYAKKIKALDLQAVVALNTSGGKTAALINDAVNTLNYNTWGIGFETFKSKFKKYSTYLSIQGAYSANKSSLQPESKNNYFTIDIKPNLDLFFLKKFQLHTDAHYAWQQKSRAFNDNFSRTIWNAWIGRNCFKDDQLIIKLSCNDILNQNSGYSRTANNTFFSENRYTTIRRFFMIGATWNFTRFRIIKQS